MGAIIDMLNSKRFASIPETFEGMGILTGELLEIVVPNKYSLNGILELSGKYLDMQILWNNMILKGENQDDEKFPQTFVIDKSAILLMEYVVDTGLGNYGCDVVKSQLSEHRIQVLNEYRTEYDTIQMFEDPELQYVTKIDILQEELDNRVYKHYTPTHPTIYGVTLNRYTGDPIATTYARDLGISWEKMSLTQYVIKTHANAQYRNKSILRAFRIARKLNRQKQTEDKVKFHY